MLACRFLARFLIYTAALAGLLASCKTPQPPPSPTPSSDVLSPPTLVLPELEHAIHAAVNRARIRDGLAALAWDTNLQALAQAHSADMGQKGYFDHVNLAGATPSDRAQAAGYACVRREAQRIYSGIGENLFQTWHYASYKTTTTGTGTTTTTYEWKALDDLAEETVQGWLASPPHRANLLNARYQSQGIGVFMNDEAQLYVTQNFC